MIELKNSGIDWLGKIPSHWQVLPAKRLFSNPREQARDDDVQLTPSQKFGVLTQEDYMSVSGSRVVLSFSETETMKHVEEGDFISHLRSFQGGLEYSSLRGKVSGAYTVLRPSRELDTGYFKHLFKSSMYVQALQTTTDQLRDGQSIKYAEFGLIPLPFPPLEEQRQIADYLDRELAEIDELNRKLEFFTHTAVERLARTLFSLLTDETNASRQDAGSKFDWAKGIPEGWQFDKLSRFVRASKGRRGAELTIEYCSQNSGDFPVYSGQTVNDGVLGRIDSYEFDTGDEEYLFTTTVGAKAMSLKLLRGKFSLSQNCMVFRNTAPERINTSFAFHFLSVLFALKRNELSEHMQASFRMVDLYQMWMMFPSLEKQRQIAEQADAEVEKVEHLLSQSHSLRDLLVERRSALITLKVLGRKGGI